MTKLMKTAAFAGVLVAFLASTALELRAAEPKNDVREGQAVVTELAPNASATTYWVAESDGWHVVTTIDIVLGRSDIADHHAVLFRGAFPGPSAGDLRSLCPRRATAGAAGPSHRRPDRNCPGPGLV